MCIRDSRKVYFPCQVFFFLGGNPEKEMRDQEMREGAPEAPAAASTDQKKTRAASTQQSRKRPAASTQQSRKRPAASAQQPKKRPAASAHQSKKLRKLQIPDDYSSGSSDLEPGPREVKRCLRVLRQCAQSGSQV